MVKEKGTIPTTKTFYERVTRKQRKITTLIINFLHLKNQS